MRLMTTLCLLALAGTAAAEEFPTKPVTLVVPYAAGGTIDVVARPLAAKLGQVLGQQVLVDNKAGAGGSIGTAAVARSAPDGYTLVFAGGGSMAVSPALYKDIPYNPVKSFAPVAQFIRGQFVVSVRASLPVETLPAMIDYVKKNPGKVNFGSAGIGSVHHLAAEMLARAKGLEWTHVPYKGGGPAWAALRADEIDVLFDSMPGPLTGFQSGKSRPLAVTGDQRIAALPQVPTFNEQGVKGIDASFFWGLAAPAGTPRPVVEKLNAAVHTVLADPEIVKMLTGLSLEIVSGSPEDLGKTIANEFARWKDVIENAGIKAE